MRNHKHQRQEKQKEKETEKNKAQTLKNIYFLYFLNFLSRSIYYKDEKTRNNYLLIFDRQPQGPDIEKYLFFVFS